jgi:hypothetical protein
MCAVLTTCVRFYFALPPISYIILFILFLFVLFFVERVLSVPLPIFARCPILKISLSHLSNQTELASQIPEEG